MTKAAPTKPLVGITMGDPLGIGPEVVVKALIDPEVRSLARFVIFGLHDVLETVADQAEINPFWWREPYVGQARVGSGVLLADFDDLPLPRLWGPRAPDSLAGGASFRFVDRAIAHLKQGEIDALVTAPICKQSWHMAKQRWDGHTHLLSHRFGTTRISMAFVADTLRVALASDHVGLFDLRNHFTIGLVQKPMDLLDRALRDWFGIEKPRIGVLGLNPHAGEGGLFGDEEQRIIEPAMALARNAGIHVVGPLSPDTAFLPSALDKYDGLVAMYHDQGLIPVKMRSFHDAVNVTLGLPAVRTSPDHGTAFDIAGKNQADPRSMVQAIRLAVRFANRQRAARQVRRNAIVR